MGQNPRTYTISSFDVNRYQEGTTGRIHEIWWQILQDLPPHLFKEAIHKGFTIAEVKHPQQNNELQFELIVPNATPELMRAMTDLNIRLVYTEQI
ncbi:MAG: hypothetical protein JNK26_04640 [Candidatus Doudnabacteria bacterium]|nr:hypothetical protein [Candidatus Doudnabacteria bacterium]